MYNDTLQKTDPQIGCTARQPYRFYNTTTQDYPVQTSVNVVGGCNGFLVKNAGTSTLFVNGIPVLPRESFSVGGNEGEIYKGRIDLTFSSGVGLVNSAWVVQKFYVDKNFV